MGWTVSKCHRVSRPLKTQISRYQALAKLYPQETLPVDYSRQRTKPRMTTQQDCLSNCKLVLSCQAYDRCMAVYTSFEYLLAQCPQDPRHKLANRAAFDIGKHTADTPVAHQQEEEAGNEAELWLESSSSLGSRYRQYICLGQAIGLINKNAQVLRHVIPALVVYSIEQDHLVCAQSMFDAFVEALPDNEFFDLREWIARLAAENNLSMEPSIVKKLSQVEHPEHYIVDIISYVGKLDVPGHDLQELTITLLASLRKTSAASFYSSQLLRAYFARVKQPCAKTVARMLKKLPATGGFVSLRKVVQLYTNYKFGHKWLNLSPEDNTSELSELFVALFQYDPGLLKQLVEFVLPVSPQLALQASSRFVSQHPDMKNVLWQDKLTARAQSKMASDEDEYDETMGVWTSKSSSPEPQPQPQPQPQKKRELEYEFDEFALIVRPAKRRRKSSGTGPHNAMDKEVDDICLIAV